MPARGRPAPSARFWQACWDPVVGLPEARYSWVPCAYTFRRRSGTVATRKGRTVPRRPPSRSGSADVRGRCVDGPVCLPRRWCGAGGRGSGPEVVSGACPEEGSACLGVGRERPAVGVPEIEVAGGVAPLPRDAAMGRVRIPVLTGRTWWKYPHCRRTGHPDAHPPEISGGMRRWSFHRHPRATPRSSRVPSHREVQVKLCIQRSRSATETYARCCSPTAETRPATSIGNRASSTAR